jgi:hypothetical protein
VTVLLSNGRAHVESTVTRERRDNLVLLALRVEEEALETTDPKETLYVKHSLYTIESIGKHCHKKITLGL